jgi:hypothetical protein
MANKIHLTGQGRYEEFVGAGAITPGHLIQINSLGKAIVHATEGGVAERLFALEDALQGKNISQAYTTGNTVFAVVAAPGDVVYAYIFAGEDIAIGDILISNGDGTLVENGSEASGVTVKQYIGVALEAADLSDSGDVSTRIKVRVL